LNAVAGEKVTTAAVAKHSSVGQNNSHYGQCGLCKWISLLFVAVVVYARSSSVR
jgi:hypothetical protein